MIDRKKLGYSRWFWKKIRQKKIREWVGAHYPGYSVLCSWWVCSSCSLLLGVCLCDPRSPNLTCPSGLHGTILTGQHTWGQNTDQHMKTGLRRHISDMTIKLSSLQLYYRLHADILKDATLDTKN